MQQNTAENFTDEKRRAVANSDLVLTGSETQAPSETKRTSFQDTLTYVSIKICELRVH